MEQSAARADAAQARMGKGKGSGASRTPTIPLTNESMTAARTAATDTTRIRVVIIPGVIKSSKIQETPSLGIYDMTERESKLVIGTVSVFIINNLHLSWAYTTDVMPSE